MFAVFEGADCSGKSTVASLLSRDYGVMVMENPPAPYALIKQAVLTECEPLSRLMFFLAGNIHAGRAARSSRQPVVCVRYIWSTLAYYMAVEQVGVSTFRWFIEIAERTLPFPDVVIQFTVDR